MNTATEHASRWLFPGRRAGQPLHPDILAALLNDIGIPTTAGRTAAIRQHVPEMPATVVAEALGYHRLTTVMLASEAGGSWSQVLVLFARALKPGGHFITATHVGDEDAVRTEAYGGVPVRWTTHKWRPEQLVELVEQAELRPVAELRLPADEQSGPGLVVMAKRPA
ncbi:hypothetical protein ABZ876_27755 [Streptomyces sp. NPDC046931]|uniref:hypothetical protein n=1 Tax=Streptomyces sp. NPDC046931 TaxID=3154806 RepID=UPI0033F1CE36